ncbi:hypothetical protein D0N36_10955 [Hymenobacter lapidiphilus]|uniref:hypothetical protein n=1 Tax=Hymenobacter sp. CCM 8763 TaxID=2303334 RepID=UPI000E3406E3|nr:hypothetical protein [Hymenobacter sp. CCM 8763]RFP65016.1 hypothetical protein D0N36_10955 [Hymenobacter sp. CCM 8763]
MTTLLPVKMLAAALRQELLADNSFEKLMQMLWQYKASGGGQEDAVHVLEELRVEMPDEELEDTVLDLMDFATGFCSPHMRIW